jgi:hypothetical protein
MLVLVGVNVLVAAGGLERTLVLMKVGVTVGKVERGTQLVETSIMEKIMRNTKFRFIFDD